MAAAPSAQAGSRCPVPGPAAHIDLDLAFAADPDLSPDLLQAAGVWLDPLQAEASWQALLAQWLAQLAAELPPALQATAYSAGLSLVDDAEIAALNADWRGKAGPTDVLAFAAQDDDLDEAPPLPLPAGVAAAPLGDDALQAEGCEPDGRHDDAAPPAAPADDDPRRNLHQDSDPGASDDGPEGDADHWRSAGVPLELGDIVISVETAARQADEHGHGLGRELLFLASHGLLHLLGWDHPDDASLAAMLARQEALLAAVPAQDVDEA